MVKIAFATFVASMVCSVPVIGVLAAYAGFVFRLPPSQPLPPMPMVWAQVIGDLASAGMVLLVAALLFFVIGLASGRVQDRETMRRLRNR